MSKYTAVIVDDEPQARENLRGFLTDYCPHVEVVGEAEGAQKGFDLIKKTSPQLVFLDIEMPGGNGFDLLTMFNGNVSFDVIFTTAYGHYAIQAIKFSALDYVMKPLDIEELQHAVKRFEEKQSSRPVGNQQIETLMHNVKQHEFSEAKLVVPELAGFTILDLKAIIYLMSDGSYTDIIMEGRKKITSSKPLRYFEEIIEKEKSFYRVSRSYMINLNHIIKYISGEGGTVLLTEKHEVDVPRRKKQEFMEIFKSMG